MELQTFYRGMDVSHLSIDEIEHELLIRNISFGLEEHESVKRRKLKDRMKHERETNTFAVTHNWGSITEEIALISSKLAIIAGLLDNPKANFRQRQKLKTRLIHYRVRIFLLTTATGSEKSIVEISGLGKLASQVFQKHFSDEEVAIEDPQETELLEADIGQALEEVRSEIEILNETMTGNETGEEVEEASGGAKKKTVEKKKQGIQQSIERTDQIMEILTGYEEGKVENVKDLIKSFKAFVVQTSEQQKEMKEREIKMEEQRIRETEENMERKKRLEKLLSSLNEKMKLEQGVNKLKFPDPPKDVDQLDPEKQIFEFKSVDEVKSKLKQPTAKSSTDEDSDQFSSSSSESEEKRGKSRKGRKSSKVGQGWNKRDKKKRRKVSFSSPSFSSSSASDSSEISSSSSESSSSSSPVRRQSRKKSKKEKRSRRSLKRIPVSEWKIKYDGKDQGRRLAEFLKEIKMRCKSEEISKKELFRSSIHLFSGRAKDWFIEGSENRDFRNWSELKRELKREFLPPDIDFQIEIQATSRRQARGEKFVDYLHDMQKLFNSMTRPISERRKFEIIWRNMRFDYKNAMTGAGIKSLSRLKKYGRIIDENNWNMFQKPVDGSSRPRVHQINELSASSSSRSKSNVDHPEKSRSFSKGKPKSKNEDEQNRKSEEPKEGREGKSERSLNPMEGSAKGTLQTLVEQYKRPPIGTCYNCRKNGHHYVDCPDKRRKFCRLCGFADVITPECPVCQKNDQNSA